MTIVFFLLSCLIALIEKFGAMMISKKNLFNFFANNSFTFEFNATIPP